MEVTNVFVSTGVADHAAGCDWWSTLLGREPDRRPVASCFERDLTDSVLFQVRDNLKPGSVDTVSLRVEDLDAGIARLRGEGLAISDPEMVPGFATLRIANLADRDGNTINRLGGQ